MENGKVISSFLWYYLFSFIYIILLIFNSVYTLGIFFFRGFDHIVQHLCL